MTTRQTRKTTADRPKRIPVSGGRNILNVDGKDANYVYRWVNDVDNRLHRFQEGGYDFVEHSVVVGDKQADSSRGTSKVVTKDVGHGVTAYLMRIKKEWYDEDQQAKAMAIRESEEAMKRSLNSGEDGRYGSVEIS